MKFKATVTETLVLRKVVEFEAAEDADFDAVQAAVRRKAYEQTVFEGGDGGWEAIDCLDVSIVLGSED